MLRAHVRSFWRALFRRSQLEQEMSRELQFHIEARAGDLKARHGLSPEEAMRRARLEFGSLEKFREEARSSLGLRLFDEFGADVRYALRTFRKAPGFSTVAVLTLALGIGATTAIFSVVHGIQLRPLGYPHAERLVHLFEDRTDQAGAVFRAPAMDLATLVQFRGQTRTLAAVGMYVGSHVALGGLQEPVRLAAIRLSPAVFQMLGVRPMLGRGIEAADERSGQDDVIVLSHTAWRTHFHGDMDVVGRRILLDGRDVTIVGVMPAGFHFPDHENQLWRPFPLPAQGNLARARMPLVAQLADGVSAATATEELTLLLQRLQPAAPALPAPPGPGPMPQEQRTGADSPRVRVVTLHDELTRPVRSALAILAVAVSLVLLIACVNVANLLIARVVSRDREFAVREALGAGRGRLVRQALAESLTLAAAGMAAGVPLAFGAVALLRTIGASLPRRDLGPGVRIPRIEEIGVDLTVLGFALVATLITATLCGVLPALKQSLRRAEHGLRPGHEPSASPSDSFGGQRVQSALVAAEIAMALMLFIGGALLTQSFMRLTQVKLGFEAENLLTFQVSAPRRNLADLKQVADRLLAGLESAPDVGAVAYANNVPMVHLGAMRTISRSPLASGQRGERDLEMHAVSGDFVRAFGMRLIEGRPFSQPSGEVIINRALARSGYLGDEPLGAVIHSSGGVSWQVVGVVDDIRQRGLDLNPTPAIYLTDFIPAPPGAGGPYFAVRTLGDPLAVVARARTLAQQSDPNAVVDNIAMMEQLISNSMAKQRLYTYLLGTFAAVALLLAVGGVYGLMAYAVVQRTHEIGIRTALGATSREVLRLVLGRAAWLTLAGLILGLAGAAATAHVLESLLFGITPLDATTFVAAALVFLATAPVAAIIPARRATSVIRSSRCGVTDEGSEPTGRRTSSMRGSSSTPLG